MAQSRNKGDISRRNFLRTAATAAAAGPLNRILPGQSPRGPQQRTILLDDGWTLAPTDGRISEHAVTIPSTVVNLSWQGWKPETWERFWTYKRRFKAPIKSGSTDRVFLHFEGVLSGATPSINGHELEGHLGGFLPWQREITKHIKDENDLVVAVDGHWLNTPPSGSPKGHQQVDYLLPSGIHREVTLRVLPQVFLDEVFAKPVNVLSPSRTLDIHCTLDAAAPSPGSMYIEAKLMDGTNAVSSTRSSVLIASVGRSAAQFTMKKLDAISLWSPATPKLYTLVLTLISGEKKLHQYTTRIGFREAKFTVDGFFLNGERTRIFGINRHELYPYTGFAMPERVIRRDAHICKHELHVNTVRCSHYPQSAHFLDACDELGLMVWEEIPGWQYIGDDAWKNLLLRDVQDMVIRDRNRPSVIVWGVRVNESKNDPPLYEKTTALAKSLDDTRACSGTMTHEDLPGWSEDVYAYDDYHNGKDGKLEIHKPIPGVPFLFAEAVGQFGYEHGGEFKQFYSRSGGARDVLEYQAKYHAQAHDRANAFPQVAGMITWCAFDYASLVNGFNAVKTPGVFDTFRIPKLGATFYQSQLSPDVKPVILPSFYWDFDTPGKDTFKEAYIFSNCDKLVVTVGDQEPITLLPNKAEYPNTLYPPFVVDLRRGAKGDEITIEGFVTGRTVVHRKMSSDRAQDKLAVGIDDRTLHNNGADMTRVWFVSTDKYGNQVRHMDGDVTVSLDGPVELVGDASISLKESGGAGAVWIRSRQGGHGLAQVRIYHPTFGTQTITANVQSDPRSPSTSRS